MAAARIREQAAIDEAALDSDEPTVAPDGLSSKNAMTEFCDEFKNPDRTANKNYAKLHSACAKISEDGGRELAKAVVHNIPKRHVRVPAAARAGDEAAVLAARSATTWNTCCSWFTTTLSCSWS